MTGTAPNDNSGDDRPDARSDGGEAGGDPPETDLTVRTHEVYPRNALFDWLDQRFELDHTLLGKAFPEDDYGSLLLGEIALFTFVVLGLTGAFLGLLYNPMVNSVTYEGNALQYAGTEVPTALASVLHITYDTTFGMFARMMRHWAAYLFIAAIALHMFRVFFTGTYRNPHEPNWLIGSTLLLFALVEGLFGCALPYDSFNRTTTTIGFQMTGTISGVGSFLQSLVFGGAFPAGADQVIPRMFFLHVFLIPATLVGAIVLHMAMLMRQKHIEHAPSSRGEDRPNGDDDSVVAGIPLFPQQFLVSTIVFLLTAATVAFLAGFFPAQRIAVIGPATPTSTPSYVGLDWFFMWVFSSLKMMPSWFGGWGRFAGGVVVPSLIIGVMMIWPLLDNPEHPVHFTTDPFDQPLQTALGAAAAILIIVLSIDGMRATVAAVLGVSDVVLYPWLVALTVGMPPFDFAIVYWLLKRRKRRPGTAG